LIAVFAIAIGAERISYLYFKARINKADFVNTMHKYLFQGNLQRAITYCSSNRAPLANIIKAGLLRIDGTEAEIQSAMDEVALQELPRIEKRTGYLAMLSNVAVLAGLLGTITGLIKSFAAVSYADAAEKAVLLAKGISEAMNCTAFGLGTAIPTLVLFSLLSGTTQHLIDAQPDPGQQGQAQHGRRQGSGVSVGSEGTFLALRPPIALKEDDNGCCIRSRRKK
jgi:biopolymer transport protein ExbB